MNTHSKNAHQWSTWSVVKQGRVTYTTVISKKYIYKQLVQHDLHQKNNITYTKECSFIEKNTIENR